jgi:hypothetical protein
MALAAIDRETEVTYIRRERDWATRAAAEGRIIDKGRMLPMLPATIAGIPTPGANGHGGNGHGNGHDHGHDHGAVAAIGPGGHE